MVLLNFIYYCAASLLSSVRYYSWSLLLLSFLSLTGLIICISPPKLSSLTCDFPFGFKMFEKVWHRTIRKEWELFWSITSNTITFSGKRNKHHTSVKLLLRKEITLQVFETQEAQKQLFGYGSSLFNAIHQTVFWILLQCIACSFLLATAPSDQFHLKSKKKN